MTSDLDVLHMHGKRMRYTFYWHWSHVQLKSDSSIIAETILISKVQLLQELSILKLMLSSYTTSNWGILGLIGKVRRYPFQWNWTMSKFIWNK
jgi:hypothetical protein